MHCYDLDPSPPLSHINFVKWMRGNEGAEPKKHSSTSLFLPWKAANVIIFFFFFFFEFPTNEYSFLNQNDEHCQKKIKKITGLITEYDTTLHYFLSHTSYEYSKWNMSNYA